MYFVVLNNSDTRNSLSPNYLAVPIYAVTEHKLTVKVKKAAGRRVNSLLGSLDRLCLVTKIWPFFQSVFDTQPFHEFFENMGRIYLEHFGGAKLFVCGQCDTFLTNRGELISSRFTGATGRAYLFGKVVNLNYRLVYGETFLKNMCFFI